MALAIVPAACIGSIDEPELPEMLSEPDNIVLPDTIPIDSAFIPSADYLMTTWMAEYSGYDPLQQDYFTIRRQMVLSPTGAYDCYVQGIPTSQMPATTATVPEASAPATQQVLMNFEHEHGTYTYDSTRCRLTYRVEYDSLVNFATGQMERFNYRLGEGQAMQTRYNEHVWMTEEYQGKRQWVRGDNTLRSSDNHDLPLSYRMNKQ